MDILGQKYQQKYFTFTLTLDWGFQLLHSNKYSQMWDNRIKPINTSWENFFEKGSVCFQKILKYILGITLEITQKVIWYVAFVLQCCFKVF